MERTADGCEDCRRGVYSGGWTHMTMLFESVARHARLWRCEVCGALWEEGEREAHVLGEAQARRDFPEAFRPAARDDRR